MERGLYQYVVARDAGISPSALCQIENGEALPRITNIIPLENALKLQRGELLAFFPEYAELIEVQNG